MTTQELRDKTIGGEIAMFSADHLHVTIVHPETGLPVHYERTPDFDAALAKKKQQAESERAEFAKLLPDRDAASLYEQAAALEADYNAVPNRLDPRDERRLAGNEKYRRALWLRKIAAAR